MVLSDQNLGKQKPAVKAEWDMESYCHNLQTNTIAKFLSNNILACTLLGDLDNNQAVIIFQC